MKRYANIIHNLIGHVKRQMAFKITGFTKIAISRIDFDNSAESHT